MILKPVARIIQDLDAKSFTVIGSPGADGLGSGALQAFHSALTGARGDFAVVLGDIAPLGRDPYYSGVVDFVNRAAVKPVHVMRGNHDGPDYEEYFGFADRAIISEDFLLIMLDNSQRRFSDDSLKFLGETMALVGSQNVIVSFHVPPPNRFSGHSMGREEWRRFEDATGVWRNRISLLLCSHSHSYFEDEVDGLRLVVTGGGGARLHHVDRVVRPEHHALEISFDGEGKPVIEFRSLGRDQTGEIPECAVAGLRQLYQGQCHQRVELTLRAEEADEQGSFNLARLYRAAARSCLHQARILFRLLRDRGGDLARDAEDKLRESLLTLNAHDAFVRSGCADILAESAVHEVNTSHRTFLGMLDRAVIAMTEAEDIAEARYHVCQSCGLLTSGSESPTYCRACGAPGHFIDEA